MRSVGLLQKLAADERVQLATNLPLRGGWYRLQISGLTDSEEVEARLDFGLGFVGHHAVRAIADKGKADLFVRLFKELCAVQLVRASPALMSGSAPEILLQRLPLSLVWRRRVSEQLWLTAVGLTMKRRGQASIHDRPRRLWGWKGLQAFPAKLQAVGHTSYQLWRKIASRPLERPARSFVNWVAVMDCRYEAPQDESIRAFYAAGLLADVQCVFVLNPSDTATREGIAEIAPRARFQNGDRLEVLTSCRSRKAAHENWLLLVQPNAILDLECIVAFAEVAEAERSSILYADNDSRDARGRRSLPEFRTNFSLDRLKSQDWLGPVVAYRLGIVQKCTAALPSRELPSAYSLCTEAARLLGSAAFGHIPAILYSRDARSVREPALLQRSSLAKTWRGRASVIIPTRNRADMLRCCVESVIKRTSPPIPEIIIHDNCSDDPATLELLRSYASRDGIRVLRDQSPFNFSRINNEAAASATGDVLVFLNNDTEVLSADWLEGLAEHACDPGVGCVGPLLLKPDGRIQHAGLVTGPGGIAAHVHEGILPKDADPVAPILRRNVSAVTGACLVIQKSKFLRVGGFDAEYLPVAFNDVDLCLRLERQGYRNVFLADVRLMHRGSATRESDDFTSGSERFRSEFRLMRERWGSRLDDDPYFPSAMRLTATGPQLRLA